jgi:hypothetical protein
VTAAAPAGRERTAGALAPHRWRPALRSPAIAVLSALVVLTGAGVAAAADWLPIFRTERVAPIAVTSTALVKVPDLSAYGDLQVSGDGDRHPVADAAAAQQQTGLQVPRVDSELPRGVTGEPAYEVGDVVRATFTFSAEKAARATAATGQVVPPPPPGLDGSQVRLEAGPGVAAVWSQPSGMPTLVVARLIAPTASSSGVPFATVRDYLLSLPGLPEDLAAQLRDFSADARTLPLPVPADLVTTSTTEVDGVPATVLASRNGAMTAVVWVEDGVLTGVAGTVDRDEVLAVARGLR